MTQDERKELVQEKLIIDGYEFAEMREIPCPYVIEPSLANYNVLHTRVYHNVSYIVYLLQCDKEGIVRIVKINDVFYYLMI